LDPKLADAYSLLGYTQAFSGEPDKGIETLKKAVELAPRDEHYQFNLANVYMMNHKADDAIVLFRSLAGSGNPEVAMHASQALSQAQNFKAQSRTFALRIENRNSQNAQAPEDSGDRIVSGPRVEAPIPSPVHFVKGKLVNVDCSASPQAVLTVTAGAKSLKLHVHDSGHVIVIGADELSCDWKNKSMSVNYRDRPDGEGDVVSLEVQ